MVVTAAKLRTWKGVFMLSAAVFDWGYLAIAGLTGIGLLLITLSLIINNQVAQNVRADLRDREKLLEYYRNTFSQLGVILIGIGVSLSVFYFQQNYQERGRRNAELQQVLAKMALQLARGSAAMPGLGEFDEVLDARGPYSNSDEGAAAAAARLQAGELAAQAAKIRLIEIDVDAREFELLNISRLLENSTLVNELDPALWFNIVRDEADVRYAVAQLANDYRDLHQALGERTPEDAARDPAAAARVREQVLDIFFDADLLRQSSRRMLARTCWLVSAGPGFVKLKPVDTLEKDDIPHGEWLKLVEPLLSNYRVGSQDCFSILGVKRPA